jgi:hypothetical protein
MVTLEKLESKIENLTEKIKAISFAFSDATLSQEAEAAKEECLAALENYLDIASTDVESRPEADDSEEP